VEDALRATGNGEAAGNAANVVKRSIVHTPPKVKRPRRTKAQMETAAKKRVAARRYHLKMKHRMTPEEFQSLKDFQDGLCYICRRARGVTKELAVDHRHPHELDPCAKRHDPKESCVLCWRGLLCSPCNDMLGHARDDVMVFHRAIDYLNHPPATRWLAKIREALEVFGRW
jgi:hypothetical protein